MTKDFEISNNSVVPANASRVIVGCNENSHTQTTTLSYKGDADYQDGITLSFFQAPIRNKTLLSLSFNEAKALAMLVCVRRHQAMKPNEAKDYTINRLHEITELHAKTIEKRIKILHNLGLVGKSERGLILFLKVRANNEKHNTTITINEKATIKDIEKTILATRLQMKIRQKEFIRNVVSIARDGYTSDHKKVKLEEVKKARRWLREHCNINLNKRGFADFGWSFNSIARYLGVSLKTAFETVKYAIENNFLVKHTHYMFKRLTSTKYETEFLQHTFTYNDYSYKVWANSYSLTL